MGVPQDHRFQYSNDLILDDFLGSHRFGNPPYEYVYIYTYIIHNVNIHTYDMDVIKGGLAATFIYFFCLVLASF
jgi:hypothetical protein